MSIQKRYDLGFSAGTLLSEAFEAILGHSSNLQDLYSEQTTVDFTIIPSNAETSQKRYFREVMKRIRALPLPVLEEYPLASDSGKRLIEFFAACKRYSIIAEFMIQVVRKKWLNLDFELDKHDFISFLMLKLASSNHKVSVSDQTIAKLAQVMLKMLRELGMYNGKEFTKIDFDHRLLNIIARSGNEWFLDVMLLTDDEKAEALQW